MCAQLLSHVQLFATPWTVAHQAPLSMEFSRLEHWSRLWFPIPGGSFQSRDQTHVSFISCIGRWILHHWATWKPSSLCILCQIILSYWVANLLEDPISSIYAKWSESRSVVSDSLPPHWLYSSWNSLGQNTGVGSLFLLQKIFPTQGLNPDLQHCRSILYQLSHNGRPKTLEWVTYSVSSRSSWPRNWTGVSCIAGGFFTNWAISEAPHWSTPNFLWHITHTRTHTDESMF